MNPEIEAGINQQINQELTASYVYLAMSAYFEQESLRGFAKWCRVQSEEEQVHAMRLFDYLLDRGGKVDLGTLPGPQSNYASPLAVFEASLAQEQQNTKSINELYDLAATLHDRATVSHLQWFLDEQVEEEALVGEVVSLVKRAASEVSALLYLNDKLGERQPEAADEG